MSENKSNSEEKSLQNNVLLVAAIGSFLTPFMGSSVNIALPVIGQEFSMKAVHLGWVATSYLLTAAMVLVPVGKLADIYGRKKIYFGGMLIYALTSLLCMQAWNGISLIMFRLIQGIGGAMIFSTGVAMITSVFPARKRGWALGWTISAVYVGLSSGPVFGGLITEYLGWRVIFLINFILASLVVIIIQLKLKKEWIDAAHERFDLAGSVIYALSILGLIMGLSSLPEFRGYIWLMAGFILLVVFIIREKSVAYPVLNIQLFLQNRVFALSNLAALINYSATFAIGFLMSIYLQISRGLTPKEAGMILITQPVLMAVISPFAGRFSDKIEPRLLASTGMLLTAVGLFYISFFHIDTSMLHIIIALLVIGTGFGLFSSPNTNAIMGSVEKKYYGLASATTSTMRLTGQMFSMGITMLILNIFMKDRPVIPQYSELFLRSMRWTLLLLAVFCFMGVFASLARGKLHRSY